MNKKKKMIYGLLILVVIAVGFIGASFALWTQNFVQSGENTIVSDCFQITLKEDKGMTLENAFPMYDKDGKKLIPYTFQVSNICNRKVEYQLNFETTNNTTLSDFYVKFMFQNEEPVLLTEKESTSVTITNGKSSYVLEKGYLLGNTTKDYSIRIWMDENVTQENTDAMNKYFEGKITITASYITKYYEEILNGTDPVLKDGLIPVTIENDGTVKKADVNQKWYEYENQEWANAVILEDENMVYRDGQIIPENNIESYFVWIPRYQYKIWNLGLYEELGLNVDYSQVQTIDIIFGTDTTTDTDTTCASPGISGESGTCSVGKYMTHPAFIAFDTPENTIKGIWVGKFETGYKGATTTSEAEVNANDSSKIQIKPNVYSWRGIQVANAFYSVYEYKREFDSHMMKNTEWGAVAYLQHSAYGSAITPSTASVRINNNESYLTGYAAVNEPTTGYTATNISCTTTPSACNEYGTNSSITQPWNTITGVLASTTGNISGIYDMSGGSWEYMMSVMLDSTNTRLCSGRDESSNSGFNGPYCYTSGELTDGIANFPSDTRYYDTYKYSTIDEDYQRRILGDATGEMGPFSSARYGSQTRQVGSWYYDEAWFVYSSGPWVYRGAMYYHGIGAGVFDFFNTYGRAATYVSFRVVLSV